MGQAVASFAVAYFMLQLAPASAYGLLSLVLLLQAFGIALVNALIGAPLLIMLHGQPAEKDGALFTGFGWVASAIALGIAALQLGFLLFSSQSMSIAVFLTIATVLQIWRFTLRCYWLNRQAVKVVQSDLLLTFAQIVPLLLLLAMQALTFESVALILVGAALLALFPLLAPIRHCFNTKPDWTAVKQGLSQQGKPAAQGVLTVELTANFHAYFVMLMSGSHAFAAIAAATLFFRPLAVMLQSLQQSERAPLVQAWQRAEKTEVSHVMRVMLRLACLAFVINVTAIGALSYWQPDWLWPDAASRPQFVDALILWSFIALLRSIRLPISTVLQAANQFEPLTRATYMSAAMTVPAVAFSWWLGGATATLFGVLFGEVILMILLRRALCRISL